MKTASTDPIHFDPAVAAPAGTVRRLAASGRVALPVVGTLIVLAGQLAEDLADSPPLQMLDPNVVLQRWLIVGLVAYLFGIVAFAERTVERSLDSVRPIVRINDAEFQSYARRMETMPVASEVVMLAVSAVVTVLLFAVLRADLLVDDPVTHGSTSLPSSPLGPLVLAGYTVFGWAFLRLLYSTVRLARALAALTRESLDVDVFDTSPLVPFGNIALALSLAPAGAIIILIITLGRPTQPTGWSVVIEASAATILALILPLWGVHRQMAAAKHKAFAALSSTVGDAFATATSPRRPNDEQWAHLANITGTTLQLRKTVQDMTTWPFRGTLAFGRALLIAAAPLIYATLSELIRITFLAQLSQP
ncbi:MAG TPA: hypothetical protein VF484_01335 [Candidatus Limnocylindrales bacterium]